MRDGTLTLLGIVGFLFCVGCVAYGYMLWALRREARGLEQFARTFRKMKRDAERSGGNIKTEATAFKDVFKP